MAKNSKRKLLLITALLTVLLSYTAFTTLLPNARAAEITVQEKGFVILNEVVGLDMENYDTVSKEGPQDLYLNVVPQEKVRYTLESDSSKLDMLCTFANGNLRILNVLESEGAPYLTGFATKPLQIGNVTLQVVDLVETTKDFLNDYQSYSGKSFYGELGSMLENVDGEENVTKTLGNVKLEVTNSASSTTFRWTYTCNGIEAPSKCVALRYKNGFLKYFIDNWDLYKIGSTSVNISEQEAIDIAMERAKTFSWKVGSGNNTFEVKDFNVTQAMIWETVFFSSLYADTARSEDLLMLYPMRHVWVSLDKFYPGNVYGFSVYVWADTGDVCYIHERVSTLDPPEDSVASIDDYIVEALNDQLLVGEASSNSMSIAWIALPAFAVVTLVTAPVLLNKKKNLPRQRSFKIGGILLCLLVSSIVLLVPISTVNAVKPTRRATIWGSESAGDTSYYGATGRKTQAEIELQQDLSQLISDYFKNDGYDASNYQGSNSLKYEILGNISYNEANYARAAVVYFDHGVGREDYVQDEWHYMVEDNIGKVTPIDHNHLVYDMDIYDETTMGKTYFAFINTCMSANTTYNCPEGGDFNETTGNPQGMPFAWTHRSALDKDEQGFNTDDYMSANGYNESDQGGFCYIGFPMGSAALDQTITASYPKYWYWVQDFFYSALSLDISVNQALDIASNIRFEDDFDETDLYKGFTAIWPMYEDGNWKNKTGPGSTLAVYGNGNIHLYEYFVHEYLDATWYGVNAGVNNADGIEGGSNDGSFAHLYATGYYGDQAVIFGDIGMEGNGHIYLYGGTSPGYNSHVLVYVSDDYSNWDPVNENLWITQSSPYWIDVGTYASDFRYIAVVVYADYAPSVLDVDSVLVIPSLPLQSSYYYVTSTTYYTDGGSVNNHENLAGNSNDGNFAYIYCGNPPDMAQIYGAMNGEASGQVEIYGNSYSGYYSDLYVFVSSDYQNWDQVGSKVTVTSTSPYWINFGQASGSFLYIVLVGYDSANSVKLDLDSVRVTP
jgi:hypothetical protein